MSQALPQLVFFKGEFMPYAEAKVGLLTHGLNYGTGCFEGIRAYWNAEASEMYALKLAAHFDRMRLSARLMYIDLQYSTDELCEITLELLRRNAFKEDVYIRPLLFLGNEAIGVKLHGCTPEFGIVAVPMGNYIDTTGIKAGVSSWKRIEDNMIPARGKLTGAYINSALAKTEAFHNGYDEAIFLNGDGHVSEGSAMNLFLLRQGKWHTPAKTDNILEGITAQAVSTVLREQFGAEVVERSIDRTELYICDELFLCGTGAQISPVVSVDHRPVGKGAVGPATKQLMEVYNQAVRGLHPAYRDWVTPVYNPAAALR